MQECAPIASLDRLTAGRISNSAIWSARLAICRHVRGAGEIGPRWRRGSNAPRRDWHVEMLTGEMEPCPWCGADGGEILAVDGCEFCPACRQSWFAGDYDWNRLSDVLRYRADHAEGLTIEPGASHFVEGNDVSTPAGHAWFVGEVIRRSDARQAAVVEERA